jgi:hypothetical protein
VEPLILAMIPELMFRFPIMSGFSLVESGLVDFALVVAGSGLVSTCFASVVWVWLVF